jgi:hypothetical protein
VKTISGYSRVGGCKLRWAAPCLVFLSACGVGTEDVPGAETEGVQTASTDTSFTSDPAASVPTSGAATTTTAVVSTEVPGSTGAATSAATDSSTAPTASSTSEPTPTPADDGRPGRTLIRRLSNQEYGATIRTLLGDDTDYAKSFPADTAVNGFTNNTDVQDVAPALAEQYMVAAEVISEKAVENIDTLLGCAISEGAVCVSTFIAEFGKKAWRRPLSSSEQSELLSLFQSEADAATGVRLVLQALLVSPSFLYRTEVGVPVVGQTYAALSSWEMASRLSYFLTGTMPDAELFAAAEANELATPAQIETQARRLLSTSAARMQVADFFSGWLNLRALERLERDSEQFPGWDSNLPLVFHDETRQFATHVVFDAGFDLNTLLTAPFTYGDPSLATYYGGTVAEELDGAARIDLPPNQRAGLLTQASFLATHAKEIQTDPVARGKFVRERILCQGIPSPPADLIISPPVITPGSTTRERFAQHEAEPSCATCHVLIDPIGLAFEHYDSIGQWRDTEDGATIDASGELIGSDVLGAYEGVVEMSAKLAQSAMVSECFVRYWFRFTFGRGESDGEAARMKTIAATFQDHEQRVQELLIAMTQTPDFLYLAKDTQQP